MRKPFFFSFNYVPSPAEDWLFVLQVQKTIVLVRAVSVLVVGSFPSSEWKFILSEIVGGSIEILAEYHLSEGG